MKCPFQARKLSGHVMFYDYPFRLCFYVFSIRFMKCSDIVVFIYFFILLLNKTVLQTYIPQNLY